MDNVADIREVKSRKIQTHTIIFVTSFHLLSIWALLNFSWQNLLALGITWWIAGSFGIGLGYHRLLTHRGFKTPKWLEYLLTVFGTLAIQGGPLSWVTTHRIHHAFAETDKDPHSPKGGVFWSHMGWIFKGGAQEHSPATHERYSPDINKNKFYLFLNNFYWLTNIPAGIILFAVGGWSMVLWGVFLRTVWGWHSTWLVNSATHIWGKRRFDTRDTSTNNALIAALTFGEGWHNNHHAYPRSARHGLKWYEIDANWIQIWALEKLGLAKDVYAFDINEKKDVARPLRKAA